MARKHHLKSAETQPAVIAVPPTETDLQLMATLGIRFEAGAYHFSCILYDNLHDAANFARMVGAGRYDERL